jgi:hypothetical protein
MNPTMKTSILDLFVADFGKTFELSTDLKTVLRNEFRLRDEEILDIFTRINPTCNLSLFFFLWIFVHNKGKIKQKQQCWLLCLEYVKHILLLKPVLRKTLGVIFVP